MTNPRMLDRRRKLWLCVLVTACSIISPAHSQVVPGTIDVHWNEGSKDCIKNPQPPIQVHRYNADTFILRENLCATYEAPFIYLLIGKTKALLIDTGAVADAKTMGSGISTEPSSPKSILSLAKLVFGSRKTDALDFYPRIILISTR